MFAVIQVFRDVALLSRVRAEIKGAITATEPNIQFDLDKLLQSPLLLSIYCETLRLNVDAYVMRYTDRADLHIENWTFPKESVVLTATTPAHTDETFWNTGPAGAHRVDQFWAERFLVYPGDSQSGPVKASNTTIANDEVALRCRDETVAYQSGKPVFSTAGTAGHYLPFGGGERICPGRHLAKRGIIATCALMVTMFDIDIRATEADIRPDPAYSGFGSQRPAKPVPFRIRKRDSGS
ncbi:MAG: hypothetical protein Q9166_006299 [cf. Caloplaca sp. 2 TL-2023]